MVIFYTNLIIAERELHPPSSIALARSFINFHRAPGAINLKCVRSGEHGGLLRCPAPASASASRVTCPPPSPRKFVSSFGSQSQRWRRLSDCAESFLRAPQATDQDHVLPPPPWQFRSLAPARAPSLRPCCSAREPIIKEWGTRLKAEL